MKYKKIFKSFLVTVGVGLIVSLATVFLLQWFHFQYDVEKTIQFLDLNTRLSVLQAGVVFTVFIWFYFLTLTPLFSSFLVLLIGLLIGIATQQKSAFRGEPLYPSDVYFLKNFRFLLEMVDGKIVTISILALILMLGGTYLFFKRRKRSKLAVSFKLARQVGFIVATLLLIYAYHFNYPGNKVKAVFNEYTDWVPYSQERNYSINGVVAGLMYNLKSPAMDTPENYSRESIEEIHEKYSKEADTVNASRTDDLKDYNIIFIMNETFSDPTRLEGVTISADPIPFYRDWSKNYRNGMALSQGLGGGTANIEFEALTGVSLEPLTPTVSTPFIQLSNQMEQIPTIIDFIQETGHRRTAIHPYNTSMYKRLENYQALGIEHFIFEEDMSYGHRIHRNNYISDESAYQQLVDVLNNSKEKDFIHLVTMQNHQPYSNKYEDVEFEVTGVPNNLEAIHYAKGLQYSDIALEQLVNVIDELDEKTIVVYWGDHLPSLYGKKLEDLNGHLKMHETPLAFYTNFSEEENNIGTISPIYFINHVLELTNTPVTPFVAMLERLETVLPAFEKGIYLERETGVKVSREELQPFTQLTLEEYDLILYDITTGKNYSQGLGFY